MDIEQITVGLPQLPLFKMLEFPELGDKFVSMQV